MPHWPLAGSARPAKTWPEARRPRGGAAAEARRCAHGRTSAALEQGGAAEVERRIQDQAPVGGFQPNNEKQCLKHERTCYNITVPCGQKRK